MKRIPYGISDFKTLKLDGCYYIDKTMYIEKIEAMPPHLFFIRPRRFGKSLLLSMLSYYYDIKYKDAFDELFADTYILNNKTKEANSYYILRFDFSVVDTDNPKESMNDYCNLVLKTFIDIYKIELVLDNKSFISNLNALLLHFQTKARHIYLILDEYDNFINKILIADVKEYKGFITDKNAIYKQFFNVLKGGTALENAPIKKMYITGVSPMALYDVTSGFNIGTNISNNAIFNSMVGVTKADIRAMVEYYNLTETVDQQVVDEWYDNYCFNTKTQETIYNTDMILYYINHFLIHGSAPDELIDVNVRSDYSKLRFLLYTDSQLNGNFTTLQSLIYDGKICMNRIVDNFSAFDLKKEENFKSLLYYLGLATIENDGFDTYLKNPNETIKRIVGGYIRESLELEEVFSINIENFNLKLKEFARSGSLEVFSYLAEVLKANTGIREYIKGEFFIKAFLLTYLSLSDYYIARSEHEMNKGFADIYLQPLHPLVTYTGLIEVKYIRREDYSEAILRDKLQEAKEQLAKYEQDDAIMALVRGGKMVKSVAIVFNGWELVYAG